MLPTPASSASRPLASSEDFVERTEQKDLHLHDRINFWVSCAVGLAAKSIRSLKKSGDLHASHSGDAAGEVFHLIGEFLIDAP